MENNLAIIPARGGSKRILRKNIKDFLGKPIIAYSIELARSSGMFHEIMVSTDDDQIAEIAKSYGASVPFFRSAENSSDHAILNDVLSETITAYRKIGHQYDFICMILPTAPLIRVAVLKDAYHLLKSENYDSVRPLVKFSYPIQRAFRFQDNKIVMIHPEYKATRSQDLEPAYHDAGQFYWINKNKTLLDEHKGGLIIPEIEAQDIDQEEDWVIAETKYKLMHNLL